jgi:hypothetical protein
MKSWLCYFTLIACLIIVWCFSKKAIEERILPPSPIYSIREWQHQLNIIEPENPIVEDGILGRNTQLKWDRIYCNYSANQVMRKVGKQ